MHLVPVFDLKWVVLLQKSFPVEIQNPSAVVCDYSALLSLKASLSTATNILLTDLEQSHGEENCEKTQYVAFCDFIILHLVNELLIIPLAYKESSKSWKIEKRSPSFLWPFTFNDLIYLKRTCQLIVGSPGAA